MACRTRRRRRRSHTSKWKRILVPLGVLIAVLAVAGAAAGTWAVDVYNSAPPLSELQPVQKGRSSAIYAADGCLIGFIRSTNIRQPVSGEQLPQDLKDATVAIEDRGFYDHGAVDSDGDRPCRAGRTSRLGKPSRGPRRSPSNWSATSTSSTPNRRSSES